MLKTALIFAAGRGERLYPLTRTTPKPMMDIKGIPLIHYHMTKLIEAGFDKIIINHAYLGYQIKHYVQKNFQGEIAIDFFAEPSGGLETGGTLSALLKQGNIESDFLLTMNADIFTDYQLPSNITLPDHLNGRLILIPTSVDYPQGNFGLTDHQRLSLSNQQYIFSGIAIYRLSALSQLPVGRFSIREWLFEQASIGKLEGEIYNGQWQDIGSLERLHKIRATV